MHRLNKLRSVSPAPRAGIAKAAVALAGALIMSSACVTTQEAVPEPPYVEKLRVRITKVRGAIAETRSTITRARGAKNLPELYVRLAELLSEEARYHYQLAFERQQRQNKVLHVPQVQFLKQQAIETYRTVLERFPDSPLVPRVRFNIAHELRELGKFDEMRVELNRLVAKHPTSPLATEALLVLGDDHFDRSKLTEAEKKYAAIVNKGVGPVAGLAAYKLAWVRVNQGNCEKALSDFESAIALATRFEAEVRAGKAKTNGLKIDGKAAQKTDGRGDVDVRRESLVDLTYCYSQERKPHRALRYFKKRAQDRATYVAALEKLARRYGIMEEAAGGAMVTRELLALGPDGEDRMEDARQLYASVRKLKSYDLLDADIALMGNALLRHTSRPSVSEESRDNLRDEFEEAMRDLATRAQTQMTKTRGRKKAKRARTVAAAYATYLELFPDTAQKSDVLLNLADTLVAADKPFRAGRRYHDAAVTLLAEQAAAKAAKEAGPDKAVPAKPAAPTKEAAAADAASAIAAVKEGKSATPETAQDAAKARPSKAGAEKPGRAAAGANASVKKGKTGAGTPSDDEAAAAAQTAYREALYDAVVMLQRALAPGVRLTRAERVEARARLRASGGALLEMGLKGDRAQTVAFAVAQTFYDEGRYDAAIDQLSAVAYEWPGSKVGDAAIQLVLDAHNTLNDIDGLMAAGRHFMAKDSPATPALRAQIKPILAAAEQRKLDELSLAAAGDEGGDFKALESFADRYAGTPLGERALLNAFVAAQAQGNAAGLYELGDQLAAKYPKSEQLPGVLGTLGQTAASRFEVDRAVQFFERAAGVDATRRVDLLVAAADMRRELGDAKAAKERYLQAIAAAEGAAAEEALSRLSTLLEAENNPKSMVETLAPEASRLPPDASARLGLAYLAQNMPDEAETALQAALDADSAGPEALARGHLGMARLLVRGLAEFDPDGDIDAIQEYVSLIEVTEQTLLNAARQGDPAVSAVAFRELHDLGVVAGPRLLQLKLPDDLSAEEKAGIAKAFEARAAQLSAQGVQAIAACAGAAWNARVFSPVVRGCLAGKTPPASLAADALNARSPRAVAGADTHRDALSKNPQDTEALSGLGKAALEGGDVHLARLVFARAVGAGDNAEAANLLGIASLRAGDTAGALSAFAQAAEAGSAAGRDNLVHVLKSQGVPDADAIAKERFADAQDDGMRLAKETP